MYIYLNEYKSFRSLTRNVRISFMLNSQLKMTLDKNDDNKNEA